MKLTALIVDDEHSGRTALEILILKDFYYLFDSVKTAASLEKAIEFVTNEVFDICFLDIQLNSNSGFELIPYLSPATNVVFVTAYTEYAIKAIKAKAFDYILKPLNPIELKCCIKRYEKEFLENGNKKYIAIKDIKGTLLLKLETIEYLKAHGAYSKIYSNNKTVHTISKPLKELLELTGQDFIRIHRSYLVNKMMIKSFNRDSLITINNTCLPVSRVHSKELSQYF